LSKIGGWEFTDIFWTARSLDEQLIPSTDQNQRAAGFLAASHLFAPKFRSRYEHRAEPFTAAAFRHRAASRGCRWRCCGLASGSA
jgi:hypothetical protein